MNYISTRGKAPQLGFDDVLLTGLARDGGLYVPESWPQVNADVIAGFRDKPYADVAAEVMRPFIRDSVIAQDFDRLVGESYARFDDPDIAPIRNIGTDHYLLELFHGPTLAFKDYALQLVGRLFEAVLKLRGEKVTIIGATSGDTGSAAIEACRDKDAIEIFILHPEGRVSEVQRRQMTTVASENVHNIAVQGTFDDCQDLVKAMFNDAAFRDEHRLSAVNSINWARIMAQIAYYFYAASRLGAPERAMTFAVPTGNFGNVYAGYGAKQMGLAINKFLVGSNRNDILTRYFHTGVMKTEDVIPSLSPSMDIQISSNFERLLFDVYERDGAQVAKVMEDFRASGEVDFGKERWQKIRQTFEGHRLDDAGTKAMIRTIHDELNLLVDPHTAVGVYAGREGIKNDGSALVCLATAHPAKFPDAVEEATGVRPELPGPMADLFERAEHFDVLPNDLSAVKSHIAGRLEGAAA